MAINRYYSAIAQDTTITSGITSSSTTVVVSGTTGYPTSYPFALALDYGSALEEIVDVTGVAGLTLTITRAVNGTSAVAHAAGATVRHVITARDLTDAQTHYNTALSAGAHGVTGALATFLGSTTSANLAAVVTDETGSGPLVFATGPTISGPTITGTINVGGNTGASGSILSSTGTGAAWVSSFTSPLTTKGDVHTYSTTDARLPVGSDGQTFVANSANATGLGWQSNFSAGKNKIINGDFGVWQRGTSFSNPATGSFAADRWSVVWDGTGATRTVSQQAFTPGGAPVAGYEGQYFYRFAQSVAGTGGTYNLFQNRIEDVRTYANQTVTISFWAKASASMSLVRLNFEQDFGTGGSPSGAVSTDLASTNFAITTSWQRFTVTTTVPSISGKTIGTTTPGYLGLRFWLPINNTFTLDVWGVQLEAGSTATAFQTATGTVQGELAACQRYYQSTGAVVAWQGNTTSGSNYAVFVQLPVQMRAIPSLTIINYGVSGFGTSPSGGTATVGAFLGTNAATSTASAAYYQFTYKADAEL